MTSSFVNQLKKLVAPETSIFDHKKKKASLIFPASEAANYSRETFYEIGVSGFTELVEVNDEFKKFRESLFGDKTKEFQRAVQSHEVNEKLDKMIEEFLLLLSPYLQKQAAAKVLEWLLHRFLINEMNVDSLMMCILPYYETILFVRILQLINIFNNKSHWHWLYQSQSKGRPIPKETVFLHWASDQWFRNFLSKYFKKMMKIHKDEKHLQLASSLFISTQIGGLASADKITENHISTVCQTLQRCLSSDKKCVLSGTFLMVGQIAMSANLAQNLLDEILKKLITVPNVEMMEHSVVCLLTVFYYQNMEGISPSILRAIEENEAILTQVSKLASSKTVSPFMSLYTKDIIRLTLSDTCLSEDKKIKKINHLVELIKVMPLSPHESSRVIRAFLQGISGSQVELKSFEKPIDLIDLLRQLDMSHPEGFDKASDKISKSASPTAADDISFQKEMITSFKTKCVLSVPSVKKGEEEKAAPLSAEEQWMECFETSKALPPSSIKFLQDVCVSINLDEDDKSFPFWEIAAEPCDEFSSSLKTLIKLLKVFICHQTRGHNTKTCNFLLKQIFMGKLGTIKAQIYFLSMIWRRNLEADDVGIDRCLKLWALNFTRALLSSPKSSSSSLSWVMDAQEPLVASLVIPICEGDFLCEAAFKVLQAMRTVKGAQLRENNLAPLIQGLVLNKEEISTDASYLPTTVASLCAEKKGLGDRMAKNLFSCVTEPDIPVDVKGAILYALSQVHYTQDMLAQLIPIGESMLAELRKTGAKEASYDFSSLLYYILVKFSSNEVTVLSVKGGWELFQASLEMSDPVLRVSGQLFSPQELVVNYKLLKGLTNSSRQLEILEVLISRIAKANNSAEASKLSKVLKKISLDASQIISLWNKYGLVPNFKSVKEARAKKFKEQKNPGSNDNFETWRKLELLIELIGVMPELKRPWLLIGPICDHLRVLMRLESTFTDTLMQQMLSVCYHLLKMSSDQLDKKEFIKQCNLNVALVVECIRTSVNPDTHRRALLILSLVSEYFPDQVLHNIMAIFTFMGTSLLRRDDSYSFQIIHLTISSIVPTLIQAQSSDSNVLLRKLSQVTQVFVDALPDLAEHRRLPLFTQLATTLGVSQYLWLVMVLIADAYVVQGTTSEQSGSHEDEPRRMPRNIQFALVLYSQFSVIDQLKASGEVINFICDLPEDKETIKDKEIKDRDPSTLVINIETRTSRQLRQLKYTCIGLLVHLLLSEKFVGQVYEFSSVGKESEELKSLYKNLLEKALNYLKIVGLQEQSQKGSASGRFWLAMQRKLTDLVDAVNSLLPPSLLVQVISTLLENNSELIRCRAMEILASKLQPDIQFFANSEVKKLLVFIDPLKTVSLNVSELENNRQTALFTLQLLVRRLGSFHHQQLILPVLEAAISIIKQDTSGKVVTQAALVIAEAVHVLKANSVAHLDQLVPALINILKSPLQEESQSFDNLIIASATAIHRIVEHVPRLLSSQDLESVFVICSQLISKQERDAPKESRLTTRLTNILDQLVHGIELRILIPILAKTYMNMSMKNQPCLPFLLSVIESMITFVKVTDLIMFKTQLVSFFSAALDIRGLKDESNAKLVQRIEGCVISTLSKFLLKLNEDDNVTIFTSLSKWASDPGNPTRLITFYRFADHLAGSLKVLFIKTKLARIIFNRSTEVLENNNTVTSEETVFGDEIDAASKASELLQYVLQTLSKIFLYDTVQFVNEEKFNFMLEPLVKQIENTVGSDDDYQTRISEHLKGCIINFTKAVGDDSLWKELNQQILLRIRTDNDSKVILAGLEIFEGLVEALGEDYLQPLVADTIPYITEVLESFDPNVEKKTKEIFRKMEKILGDNLRAYLDV